MHTHTHYTPILTDTYTTSSALLLRSRLRYSGRRWGWLCWPSLSPLSPTSSSYPYSMHAHMCAHVHRHMHTRHALSPFPTHLHAPTHYSPTHRRTQDFFGTLVAFKTAIFRAALGWAVLAVPITALAYVILLPVLSRVLPAITVCACACVLCVCLSLICVYMGIGICVLLLHKMC